MPWGEGRFARCRPRREKSGQRKPWRADRWESELKQLSFLDSSEIQFQSELELPRVEGCCRAAVVAAVRGALLEAVDVVDESRSGAFIETIKKVEALGDDIQTHSLTQSDGSHQTHVE